MRSGWKTKTVWLLVASVATLLALSSSALGQCSMCRAALAGSNNPFFIRNFNIGVLVLLVPPVTIFCSIFVALKRHNAGDQAQSAVESLESPVRAKRDDPERQTTDDD